MSSVAARQPTSDLRAVINDGARTTCRHARIIMNGRSHAFASWLRPALALSAATGGSGLPNGPGRRLVTAFLCAFATYLSGCSSLLPTTKVASEAPWRSFDEAMLAFDSIKPAKTTVTDLKSMGIDPFSHDNVTILNYADLIRRFAVPGSNSLADLDAGLRQCIEAMLNCQGYEIDLRDIRHDRTGNFWLDFLNFRRIVKTTGWRFTATLVINRDIVVYKLWNGQPSIREVEDAHNPLGPAQGLGLSTLQSLR